jgi:hypothetical protein
MFALVGARSRVIAGVKTKKIGPLLLGSTPCASRVSHSTSQPSVTTQRHASVHERLNRFPNMCNMFRPSRCLDPTLDGQQPALDSGDQRGVVSFGLVGIAPGECA